MKQVVMYIDYDNLYISLENKYKIKAIDLIKEVRKKYEDDNNNLRLIKAFCDFSSSAKELSTLEGELIELRHINSIGNGKTNASDIGLSIDVIKSLYNNINFEKYIIISSDSDMNILIKELKFHGKDVTLVYLQASTNPEYLTVLEKWGIELIAIEDLMGLEIYNPKKEIDLQKALEIVINTVSRIATMFEKNGKLGTTGKKNILDDLEKEFVGDDAKQAFEKLIKEGKLSTFDENKRTLYYVDKTKIPKEWVNNPSWKDFKYYDLNDFQKSS